mgnify:FL=1
MSEVFLYDKLKNFAQSFLMLFGGLKLTSVLMVRSMLSELAFDSCTYVDDLLGLHAHRSWLLETTKTKNGKLEKLKHWILLLQPWYRG